MSGEPELHEGISSEDVLHLQQVLRDSGYWHGPIDGAFDESFAEAVRVLQGDHGLWVTGVVDAATWDVVNRLQQPQSGSGTGNGHGATGDPHGRPTLREGVSSEWVLHLQEVLQHYGYWHGSIDGAFDYSLEQAIVAFQAAYGLVQDGIVGPRTWHALDTASVAGHAAHGEEDEAGGASDGRYPTLAKGVSGEWVIYLQQLMWQRGVWRGPINGSFDDALELAVWTVQGDCGLAASGVVDEATWRTIEGLPDSVDPTDAEAAAVDADEPAPGMEFKRTFATTDKRIGKPIPLARYATVEFKWGGSLTVAVRPGPEPDGAGASFGRSTKSGSDLEKYQVEVEHEFDKIVSGLLDGYTPKVSIGAEGGEDGTYKVGVEGALNGERTEFKFGFTFVEADSEGEITFAALEAEATVKPISVELEMSDGTKLSVVAKVKLTAELEPNYQALLQEFLMRCAQAVTAEIAIVGGAVAASAVLVIGTALTIDDGSQWAQFIDEAARARNDYVEGFIAGITPGSSYSFDNDFTMEGYQQGTQWLRDLQYGSTGTSMPIPESVLKQQVAESADEARANAIAAVNRVLHEWLVQKYWDLHWGRANTGQSMDTMFRMLMEGAGFGRPTPEEARD